MGEVVGHQDSGVTQGTWDMGGVWRWRRTGLGGATGTPRQGGDTGGTWGHWDRVEEHDRGHREVWEG